MVDKKSILKYPFGITFLQMQIHCNYKTGSIILWISSNNFPSSFFTHQTSSILHSFYYTKWTIEFSIKSFSNWIPLFVQTEFYKIDSVWFVIFSFSTLNSCIQKVSFYVIQDIFKPKSKSKGLGVALKSHGPPQYIRLGQCYILLLKAVWVIWSHPEVMLMSCYSHAEVILMSS